ncbi:MAG: DNA mismatch repair protein MutS [Deltaproteobacteria bacterium]|nr:DNA mismatch repair protein MutS [Deltaproteobacteria bacterium]
MARRQKKPKSKDPSDTPMMRQYLAVKQQYPDAILFYRMGDFFEMFFDDAVAAAEALDLTLTSRNKNDPEPIPMCGVPHHAALGYISRLIDHGFKVAVCEQMEDPAKVKGLVKREVVRVITPGVVLDEENLDAKAANYLAAVLPLGEVEVPAAAVAVIDASTYEFRGTCAAGLGGLAGEVFRLEPREILVPASAAADLSRLGDLLHRCFVTVGDDSLFEEASARQVLVELLGADEASKLFDEDPLLARAAGAAAAYVRSTRPGTELPVSRFVTYAIGDHMVLDEATKSHLELVRTADGERKGSLLWLIDRSRTGMGGRLLRRWVNYPLTDVARIRRRLDRVELFFRDAKFREDVLEALSQVADVERISARIGMHAVTPRDLGVLRDSLMMLPDLDDLLTSCPAPDADSVLGGGLDRAEDLAAALAAALVDEPPATPREGGVFREGFDEALDDLTHAVGHAKDFISSLQVRERERTGISSLKVSFNKVFGYYIGVTKANLGNVPDDYVRKQTLATGERYVTPELEEWESKVLSADERRKELEQDLFRRLVDDLGAHVARVMVLADRLAGIDCAASLAEVARSKDFVRPEVDSSGVIEITESRHPLVEALQPGTPFVPNDVRLDPDGERLLIITGPNMAGKSTAMRQVALIAVLAQMGSFVPASAARVGVCDRLFTRVGASDNIARGESTFMVEMNETSSILRGASRDSLVILDEVGRGTSTYDGLSIAWAVGEYLHDAVGCKVMFATHFHELVELANLKPHAANYHVAAREYGEDVVFLRKLVEGGTSRSFGIQVARMAGLPELVVQRAREVLRSLEEERPAPTGMPETARQSAGSAPQLDLFAANAKPSEVERVLKEIDLDRLTPLEALALLSRLRGMIEDD